MSSSALRRNPYFNGKYTNSAAHAGAASHAQPQFNQAYGTVPQQGYAQPGNAQPGYAQFGQAYGAQQQYQQPAPSPQQLDQQFNMPSPSSDELDRMSYEDTITKTFGMFGLLVAVAALTWVVGATVPGVGLLLAMLGAVGTLVLSIVMAFRTKPSPVLTMVYTVFEGLFIGGASQYFEQVFPGIVLQAALGTLAVLGVTLTLFAFGKVRTSPRMTKIVLVAVLGLIVFSLVNIILQATGVVTDPWGLRTSVELFGIPLGVLIGLVAVFLGAYMLVMDFEFVKNGVESGAPRAYGWIAAYSLVSTVTYIYFELLRIIAILRSNE